MPARQHARTVPQNLSALATILSLLLLPALQAAEKPAEPPAEKPLALPVPLSGVTDEGTFFVYQKEARLATRLSWPHPLAVAVPHRHQSLCSTCQSS